MKSYLIITVVSTSLTATSFFCMKIIMVFTPCGLPTQMFVQSTDLRHLSPSLLRVSTGRGIHFSKAPSLFCSVDMDTESQTIASPSGVQQPADPDLGGLAPGEMADFVEFAIVSIPAMAGSAFAPFPQSFLGGRERKTDFVHSFPLIQGKEVPVLDTTPTSLGGFITLFI